jgi:hypothetical protein
MELPRTKRIVRPGILLCAQGRIVQGVAVPKAIRKDLVPNNTFGPGWWVFMALFWRLGLANQAKTQPKQKE